ncbi:putative fucosyltransferase-like protein [Vitis vinifera]|uniref:Fucosyltransferase n=1 Tax=Vitis vinifera TaxID=29760 RepID=A0A438FMR9_VITVI|nr:putative fucosyltransferase-like protein [Vitis vinifera]
MHLCIKENDKRMKSDLLVQALKHFLAKICVQHLWFSIYFAVDKVQALKRYKFSLAFENSNEEDYVTEKFFQSLVAGTKAYFFLA